VCKLAPALHLRFLTCDAGFLQTRYFGVEIIAHQVKFVQVVLVRRMDRDLGGREFENQPPMADIDMTEFQYIPEERFVAQAFPLPRVSAVDDS